MRIVPCKTLDDAFRNTRSGQPKKTLTTTYYESRVQYNTRAGFKQAYRENLDDNLTWKPHISLLASKLSKSIAIIHKSRFFLSTQSLRTLHSSMILPYLYYCNLASGGTYKANLQRIVILQKRALRIVNNSTYDANTSFMMSSRFN